MPYVLDRVRETTTTTGTGNVSLAGAPTGFRTFNAAAGVGPAFYYCIATATTGSEWEVGEGHLSASTTLVRDTVFNSSNAGAAVNFSAGTKDVFVTIPEKRTPTWTSSTGVGLVRPDGTTYGSQTYSLDPGVPYLGINTTITYNAAGTATTVVVGNRSDVTYTGAGNITGGGHIVGSLGSATVNATGRTIDLAIGSEAVFQNQAGSIGAAYINLSALVGNTSGETITNLAHYFSQLTDNAGIITNWYGQGVNILANTGTISNAVGFYVNEMTVGTVTRARSFANDDPDAPITSEASICDGSQQTFTTPGNGATLTLVANRTLVVILDVAVAGYTIKFPAPSAMEDGQVFELFTQDAITTITWDGNGSSVFGQPTGLAALGSCRFRYYAAGPYMLRIQ